MNKTLSTLIGASALAAGLLASYADPSFAFGVSFENIFPISSSSPSESSIDPYVGNFSAEVIDLGSGKVKFEFKNNSSIGKIGDVYIEIDPNILLANPFVNFNNVVTNGVNFGNHSGAFPQGSKVSFNDDYAYKFTGGAVNQVDISEVLGVRFDGNYSALQTAFNQGKLRIGMHIQQITYSNSNGTFSGASDSIISTNPVPEPITLLGSGIALGFGTYLKRKMDQAKKA